MWRLELAPRAVRLAQLRQRRPWITLCQQDGTGSVGGEGVQIRRSDLSGDPSELIGSRARCRQILGLQHELDASGEQA